jgi:hypothetical protein
LQLTSFNTYGKFLFSHGQQLVLDQDINRAVLIQLEFD